MGGNLGNWLENVPTEFWSIATSGNFLELYPGQDNGKQRYVLAFYDLTISL